MTVLILIVLISVLVSANCSLYEAILYSTRLGTLEAAKAAGIRAGLAQQFIELKKNIGIPIASILILNTVAMTAGATIAGAYAGDVLESSTLPLFSAAFTLLILFFGEIMPKTLGVVYWRRLWPFIVWPLNVMKYVLYPAVVVTQKFSELFTSGRKLPTITEEEILAAVRMGAMEGQISDSESALVHNIINLENKPVREIMTPRTVIFSLDAHMSVDRARRAVDGKGLTRIPIYEGHTENITGYVMIHDLYSSRTPADPSPSLQSMAKPISFVPATRNSLSLLTTFLKHRRHISIVVDEYGGVAGLVTLEDLIETVLGAEIVDETDRVVDLQERARQLGRRGPES